MLGARQHAVFTPAQLAAIGIKRDTSRQRVRAGRLFRVHQGVYSLVPAALLSQSGRFLAAVFACGPTAVLSHRSAAALLDLRATDRRRIDVTVTTSGTRTHPGIDVHRSRTLAPEDITTINGIAVTTVARTLLDLAEVIPRRGVERAFDQAEASGRLDANAIEDQLARNHGRHRAHILKAILERAHPGHTVTASNLEEAFLALMRRTRLPEPECNALIVLPDGGEPIHGDFVWREQRLIVETDSRRHHFTTGSFEGDRKRDQRCLLAGWRVVRVTWRQVVREPARIAELIATLLA